MLFADENDSICRNYTILSWKVDRAYATSWSLNTDVSFVLIDLLSFPIRIRINDPTTFTHSEGINLPFFSFCLFSDIVLHRVHQKFEVVFPIYGLWLTLFWTLSKDFTEIHIVYVAQIPHNDVGSGILFEWRIVTKETKTVRRSQATLVRNFKWNICQ